MEWFEIDTQFDPRAPLNEKEHNPVIKHGVILKIVGVLAVTKFDDGTVTLPTPLGCFTPQEENS